MLTSLRSINGAEVSISLAVSPWPRLGAEPAASDWSQWMGGPVGSTGSARRFPTGRSGSGCRSPIMRTAGCSGCSVLWTSTVIPAGTGSRSMAGHSCRPMICRHPAVLRLCHRNDCPLSDQLLVPLVWCDHRRSETRCRRRRLCGVPGRGCLGHHRPLLRNVSHRGRQFRCGIQPARSEMVVLAWRKPTGNHRGRGGNVYVPAASALVFRKTSYSLL